VVVPDKQLSLAIGKEGQNVRLAAKLAGWRIDIKSASVAEAERAAAEVAKPPTEVEEAIISEELPEKMPAVEEPSLVSAEAESAAEPVPVTEIIPPVVSLEPEVAAEKPQVRFAEDILAPGPAKSVPKSRKKKKGTPGKEDTEGIRRRKHRRQIEISTDDEEY
jgi:N utilization substance protein A